MLEPGGVTLKGCCPLRERWQLVSASESIDGERLPDWYPQIRMGVPMSWPSGIVGDPRQPEGTPHLVHHSKQ